MKPNKYWYSLLTLTEKLEWRRSMRDLQIDIDVYLCSTSPSFYTFIDYSFNWGHTIQDKVFWQKIALSKRLHSKFSNTTFDKITFNNEINGNKSMVFS